MFSKRVESLNASPIRKFAPFSEAAKAAGKNVIPLNIGQPDLASPKSFYEAIIAANTEVIAYTPSDGIKECKLAFSNYLKRNNTPIEPEDLLITNGGSEALLFAFATICDPGDKVLAFEPFYTNYKSIARIVSAELKGIVTTAETDFAIPSYEDMAKLVDEKTKAIILTNPSNPTGHVMTRDEVERIIKLALDHNLYIIVDEVYREFVYDGAEFIRFIDYTEVRDRIIIIDSVSKRFNVCGARIGCIATKNTEFIAHCLKMCQARLSVAYAEQKGAVALLNEEDEYTKESVETYKRRRDVCMEYIEQLEGVSCKKPKGAFYFIVKLPIQDADHFVGWLLSEFALGNDTIMLCPAKECYSDGIRGRDEVRISYCIDEHKLKRAMEVLQAGLKEYKSKFE